MSLQQLIGFAILLVVDAVLIVGSFAYGVYKGVTAPESVRSLILDEPVAVYECFQYPYTEYKYEYLPHGSVQEYLDSLPIEE